MIRKPEEGSVQGANDRPRFSALDWLCIVVLVGGAGYVFFGPTIERQPSFAEASEFIQVAQSDTGEVKADFDDPGFQQACAELGLPDPAELDGGDPVPIGVILEQYTRWAEHRDLSALTNLGYVYLALEEHAVALQYFAALHGAQPDNADSAYFLGVAAQALGMDDLAIDVLTKAGSKDTEYATIPARLGEIYLESGDLDNAREAFEHCRAIQPARSLPYVGLGRVALKEGDSKLAEELLTKATQITVNDFRAHRFLSQALSVNGKPLEAERTFKIAESLPQYSGWLVFDPRLQQAHALANTQRYLENQMRLLRNSPDRQKLIDAANELIKRRPRDYQTLGVLAESYLKIGNPVKALESVEKALEIQPDSAELLSLRAQIHMMADRYDEALASADEAIRAESTYATAHNIRGRVLFLMKRMEEATAAMRTAITLQPRDPSIRLVLAVMYQRMQKPQEAERVLHELLQIAPDNQDARRMLQSLQQSTTTPRQQP